MEKVEEMQQRKIGDTRTAAEKAYEKVQEKRVSRWKQVYH